MGKYGEVWVKNMGKMGKYGSKIWVKNKIWVQNMGPNYY